MSSLFSSPTMISNYLLIAFVTITVAAVLRFICSPILALRRPGVACSHRAVKETWFKRLNTYSDVSLLISFIFLILVLVFQKFELIPEAAGFGTIAFSLNMINVYMAFHALEHGIQRSNKK